MRHHYFVATLCQYLDVSQSGYYRWLKDPLGIRGKSDLKLKPLIWRIFMASKQVYGSPRVCAKLRNEGYFHGRNRIARLMDEMGLRSIMKRKYKATTDSRHNKPVAKNHLSRQFKPAKLNQVWAGDITYIATKEGWLYLAVVMDLHSRKIIGWSMSKRMKASLVCQALKAAIDYRKPAPGTMFHSDRGVQYASEAFQSHLSSNGIKCSMSRKGNCWDNAVVESFFNSLKQEWLHHRNFQSRNDARNAIFEYIEGFYNRHRLHSTLGYKSPEEYEILMAS
jgi:transposase InsO family protein